MADLPSLDYFTSKYMYFNFVYILIKQNFGEYEIEIIRELTLSYIRANHPDFFIDFAPSFYDDDKL